MLWVDFISGHEHHVFDLLFTMAGKEETYVNWDAAGLTFYSAMKAKEWIDLLVTPHHGR